MPKNPHIVIIVASTRPTRFADKPLSWLLTQTAKYSEFTFEVLDLREKPLPFYESAGSPASKPREYGSDAEAAIGATLDAADGFLIVTPEYNHGYTAALKNLLDHFYIEWNRKPVAFLGYGAVGAARAIEQLRAVTAELDMASVRPTVNVVGKYIMDVRSGMEPADAFAPLEPRLEPLLADLHWWAVALGKARKIDLEQTDASDEDA